MKNRILSILITLCLISAIIPITPFSATAASPVGTGLTQAMFTSAGNSPTDSNPIYLNNGKYRLNYTSSGGPVNYYLAENISLDKTIDIWMNITLDLNGKTITMTQSYTIIKINLASILTLNDSGSGKITFQSGKSGYGINMDTHSGFTMNGGTISNCTTGVYMPNIMAEAVQSQGNFTMNGGTISNCTNSQSHSSGGVYVGNGQTFIISGTLSNCTTTTTYSAGGVYICAGGTFTMKENAKIDNCKAVTATTTDQANNVGGVYMEKGNFTMSNGTITNCSSDGKQGAGAVLLQGMDSSNKAVFTMTGGTIQNCSHNNLYGAGGVYVKSNSEFTMTGGTLLLCNANSVNNAGGVYTENSSSSFTLGGGSNSTGINGCYVKTDSTTESLLLNPNASLDTAGGVVNHGIFTVDSKGNFFGCGIGGSDSGNVLKGSCVYNYGTMNANGGSVDLLLQDSEAVLTNSNGGSNITTFANGCINYGTISAGKFNNGVVRNNRIVSGGDFTGATVYNICKIVFDTTGGSTPPDIQWRACANIDQPDNPTKPHYTFDGWYYQDKEFDFTVPVFFSPAEITLTAKWTPCDLATFTAPTGKNGLKYTGEAMTLINPGTANGGTMMYKLNNGSWSTSVPKATEPGTYNIYYKVSADNNHTDTAENGPITVTIDAGTNEWTDAPKINGWTYGNSPETPSATAKFGTVSVKYSGTANDGSYYNSTTPPTKAGNYFANFSVSSNIKYTSLTAIVPFTVSKAVLTVKAKDKEINYGDEIPLYTAELSGWKNGDNSSVLKGELEFDCDYRQFSDKDDYSITPKGYEADNYTFNYSDGTLKVNPKPITVTIDSKSSIYGNDIATLTAVDNGIVNGDENVYSLITTATIMPKPSIGKYDILGTALDDNYSITFVNQKKSYEIKKRELTVTVSVADKQYDGKNNATISSAALNNIANSDRITLINGVATFESVGVANGIGIDFTEFSLSGNENILKNYTLIQPTGVTANITNGWHPTIGTEFTSNSNGWLNEDLIITAETGYELSLSNTADGAWSNTLNGSVEGENSELKFFVRNKTTGAISESVTVNYKLDKNTESTGTTGTVEFVGRNSWQEFINTVTFGLFFKDEVTVKATAEDKLSGIKSIEYSASETAVTLENVKNITDWTAMPNSGIGVTLEDAKTFVYYIRITDLAGNITYISTDGAEYDTTSPLIKGIENGKTYYTTRVVTVTDKNLDKVELNGIETENFDGKLTLSGNTNATYTVKATDKAGNTTEYTVIMKVISDITNPIKNITVDKVKSKDKENIEKVIEDIENELKNKNMTDKERQELNKAKETADKLIDRIKKVKNATDNKNINKLKNNKSALKKAENDLKKALKKYKNNLTDKEKKAIKKEIKNIEKLLDKLNNANGNSTSPSTGDSSTVALLFALLFISGGVLTASVIYGKKKNKSSK